MKNSIEGKGKWKQQVHDKCEIDKVEKREFLEEITVTNCSETRLELKSYFN